MRDTVEGQSFYFPLLFFPLCTFWLLFIFFRPLSYILCCLYPAFSKGIAYSAICRLDNNVMQEVWSGTLRSMSCFCELGPFKLCLIVCFQAQASNYLLLMSVLF